MWADNIDNTIFITKLYDQIPELTSVKVEKIKIDYDGQRLVIVVRIPRVVDHIPVKWYQNGYNSAVIEFHFWYISNISLLFMNNTNCSMEINKEDNILFVKLNEGISLFFTAKCARIDKVYGYNNI